MRDVVLPQSELSELSMEVLRQGGVLWFRACTHGSSMFPFIRNGDVVTIQPQDPARLRRGDIVLYRSASNLPVLHRIVRRDGQDNHVHFLIRGDAACGGGERVGGESVWGQAVSLQRHGRMMFPNQGWMRLAGLVWCYIHPLGPLCLYPVVFFSRRAGRLLARLVVLRSRGNLPN